MQAAPSTASCCGPSTSLTAAQTASKLHKQCAGCIALAAAPFPCRSPCLRPVVQAAPHHHLPPLLLAPALPLAQALALLLPAAAVAAATLPLAALVVLVTAICAAPQDSAVARCVDGYEPVWHVGAGSLPLWHCGMPWHSVQWHWYDSMQAACIANNLVHCTPAACTCTGWH